RPVGREALDRLLGIQEELEIDGPPAHDIGAGSVQPDHLAHPRPVGTELYAQPRQGFEEAVAAHADRIRFAIAVRAASVHLDLRATSTQKNKRNPHPKE